MSSFASLGLGARALHAAQRGLEVTGQNISNVATPGYSRQRLDQVAQAAMSVPAIHSRREGAGDGVLVTGIERIRDEFLERRAQQARGAHAGLSALQAAFASVEGAFGEPSDTGLQAQMSSFWNSWNDMANDPTGAAPRNQLLERAAQLAGTFARTSDQLAKQWADTREQLNATVAAANSMAADVARLNDAIRGATIAGTSTNELADQRDLLVVELGKTLGALATAGEDGVVNVSIGGTPLVTGSRSSALAVSGPGVYLGSPGSVTLTWAAGGSPAAPDGGTVQGMLAVVNDVVPGYLAGLDQVAAELVATVNAQQAAGFDRSGAAGQPLFAGTTAATIAVVLPGPDGLAASAAPPPAYDGDNAIAMAAHATDATGADASFRSMIVQLGVQAQSIGRQTAVQGSLLAQADAARLGVSSVSIDEEMTNLMTYQHAYEAAARFVNAIDATLEALIHMTR